MKTRECPSCAMEVDNSKKVCPICGYEFPGYSSGMKGLALILAMVFLYLIFRYIL